MNLNGMRAYVRMQLDMDDEELPNAVVDAYLQEGFERTIAIEQRWPFYEMTIDAATTVDSDVVDLPPGIEGSQVMSVIDVTQSQRLIQISNEQAEDTNSLSWQSAGQPVYYTIWGTQMRLWPSPRDARTLRVRGYRSPTPWIDQGAGAVPDCDERLHLWIVHYAIALCYAQQEDEVLEGTYMKRWQAGLLAAHEAICNPRRHRPLILNGGLPIVSTPHAAVAWSNPPVSP